MNFKKFQYGKIPVDWVTAKVVDYTEIVTDYVANGSFASLKKNVTYHSEPNYAVLLRLLDFKNGFDGDYVFIDESAYEFLSKTKLFGGEIIISNVGANVGTVFRAPKLKYKMNLGPNSIMLKTKGDDTFYYYWFLGPAGQNSLQSIVTGSAQPKFNKTNFRSLEIPVPSIQEQEKIGKTLSAIDNKIEINNQISKKLETMAKTLFKHWFSNFEFPNENGKPYRSSGGDMIQSELGMIPKGWVVDTLDNIVELSTKSVNPQKHPERIFEHFSIPALDNNKTPEVEMGKEIKSSKYIISDNVILISKLNPNTKRIWNPYPQSHHPICSTEFMVYQPKTNDIHSYVYELINSDTFSDMLVSHATGSTGSRQRVKPSDTLQFKFALPPINIMNEFSKMIEPIHNNISMRNIENRKLSLTRDSILPKLMSGEIRVPLEN